MPATKTFFLTIFIVLLSSKASAALTELQKAGMYRHGIWEWSINKCPEIVRNKSYWYALKEVGGFKNADQIIKSENTDSFRLGWEYMDENSRKFGLTKTCNYAAKQWPAVLWREEASGLSRF